MQTTKKSPIVKKVMLIIVGVFLVSFAVGYLIFETSEETKALDMRIQYGKADDQNLRIYSPNVNPKSKSKLPVILYAHGGGWSAGDKSNVSEKPRFFNNQGYAFVSMNYRLSPKVTYKDQAADVAQALKWVRTNAKEYNFDPDNIILMGHSAGGHLMSLVATDDEYFKQAGISPSIIRGVINVEGPVDIVSFVKKYKSYTSVFGKDESTWAKASPLTYANKTDLPPMLILSHKDSSIDDYMNKSKEAGNRVVYYEAASTSHSDMTKHIGTDKSKEATGMSQKVTAFLKLIK